MADDNKVTIELDLDNGQFIAKMGDSQKIVQNFGESSVGHFSKVGTSIIELDAALELLHKGFEAVEVVFDRFVELLKSSIEEASKTEQAITFLNQSLENNGFYTKETSENMIKLAESMQETTNFSKDQVMNLEALANNYSHSAEESERLTKASIELSAATGKDVNMSMRILGLSLEGYGNQLHRIVPGIEAMTKGQLENGGAIDYVTKLYAGSAAAAADTYSGRVTKLTHSFEDVQKSIGNLIIQSPVVNKLIEGLSNLFVEFSKNLSNMGKGDVVGDLIKKLLEFGQIVVTYVVTPLEAAMNIGSLVWNTMKLGANELVLALAIVADSISRVLIDLPMMAIQGIGKVVSVFNKDLGEQLQSSMKQMREQMQVANTDIITTLSETSEGFAQNVKNSFKSLSDYPLANSMAKHLESIQKFVANATISMKNLSDKGGEKLTEFQKRVAAAVASVNDQLNKGLAKTAAESIKSLTISLLHGGDAFKNLSAVVLASLGTMAQNMGATLIASGFAIEALKSLAGGAAIAAGVALIALGSILSDLSTAQGGSSSGGGGGGSASPPNLSGGDTGGGGVPSLGGAPAAATGGQMSSRQASIVINGDFLNSRETANHLTDIIRQNSDITNFAIVAQGQNYG